MENCARTPSNARRTLAAIAAAALLALGPLPAEAQTAAGWVPPRTEYGYPDLQGNWTNGTMTPVQRPKGLEKVLTDEQVEAIEGGRQEWIAAEAAPSDPDREAPPEGGVTFGDPLLDGATGGTGGYNYFYIDAGDHVARYNGEPRSSLVVDPADGRIPALTDAARAVIAAETAREAEGAYDNPEDRDMGERCLLSFGNNLGPPLLPNYFYNNNYTIVQTGKEVLIFTEMVHDYRIIRLGEPKPLPDRLRPWFGDSWGRWEGDTLVVETGNMPLKQVNAARYVHPGGSEQFHVTERFTRVDADTINYEFTVDDPGFYSGSWSGEVPMKRMDDLIYEYACHEANYSLYNVLSGARAQEAMEE